MDTNWAQKGYSRRSLVNGAERTHVCGFSLARINLTFGVGNDELRGILKGDLRRRGFSGIQGASEAGALMQVMGVQ